MAVQGRAKVRAWVGEEASSQVWLESRHSKQRCRIHYRVATTTFDAATAAGGLHKPDAAGPHLRSIMPSHVMSSTRPAQRPRPPFRCPANPSVNKGYLNASMPAHLHAHYHTLSTPFALPCISIYRSNTNQYARASITALSNTNLYNIQHNQTPILYDCRPTTRQASS